MKGQNWNWEALLSSYQFLLKPSLLKPKQIIKNIAELNFKNIKTKAKYIAFDKDNTLTRPYAIDIDPRLQVIKIFFKFF
jgi:hypothetical protein